MATIEFVVDLVATQLLAEVTSVTRFLLLSAGPWTRLVSRHILNVAPLGQLAPHLRSLAGNPLDHSRTSLVRPPAARSFRRCFTHNVLSVAPCCLAPVFSLVSRATPQREVACRKSRQSLMATRSIRSSFLWQSFSNCARLAATNSRLMLKCSLVGAFSRISTARRWPRDLRPQ
jgi:hypothetical protein